MNKTDLINQVADRANLSKADGKKAVDAVFAAISDALKEDDKVTLVGFGSWAVSDRKERMGRNPQTGKEIKIAAKKVVKFKPSSELR